MFFDQFGRAIVSQPKHAYAAAWNDESRPWFRTQLADFDKLIPQFDRERLLGISQRLYDGWFLCRGAINQRATLSTVDGWRPFFRGKSTEWGLAAVDLLKRWFLNLDVRGQNFDFWTLLRLWSIAIDRDGDFFILMIRSQNGWPLLQMIPAHRIGTRDNNVIPLKGSDDVVLKSGRFEGAKISQGVIQNRFGRPIGYNVLGDAADGSEDRQIPAFQIIHVSDPTYFQQSRGIPVLIAGLNDCRDALQSGDWEKTSMLGMSSIALAEWNEHGAGDPDDPTQFRGGAGTGGTGPGCDDSIQTKTIGGGAYRFFRSGTGDKIEQLNHSRPGPNWEAHQNRLDRQVLASIEWPVSFVLQATGQGTAERADIVRAARKISERQKTLRMAAMRVTRFALASFIRSEALPEPGDPGDWLRIGFAMPPKITIDEGRDAKGKLDLWRAGHVNKTEIVAERGGDIEEHLFQRAHEVALSKNIREQVSASEGQEVTEEEMGILTQSGIPGTTVLNPALED